VIDDALVVDSVIHGFDYRPANMATHMPCGTIWAEAHVTMTPPGPEFEKYLLDISVAVDSQAAVAVSSNLRNIPHALRAYPTPYGAAIAGGPQIFGNGACVDEDVACRLRMIGNRVTDMAIRSLPVGA
jgi:hypothetical protein